MHANESITIQQITGLLKSWLARLALVLGAATACADNVTQAVKPPVDVSVSEAQSSPIDLISQDLKQTMQDGGLYVLLSELQLNSEVLYRAALDTMTLKQMYRVNNTLNALLEEQRKANHLLTIIAHNAR